MVNNLSLSGLGGTGCCGVEQSDGWWYESTPRMHFEASGFNQLKQNVTRGQSKKGIWKHHKRNSVIPLHDSG